MKGSAMTPAEFAAARSTLGLSIEDLAAELNAPPHSVVAMEQGTIRIPKRIGADLAWRAAVRQQEKMLAASGIPECPTEAQLLRELRAAGAAATISESEKRLERITTHAATCPVCRARSEWLAQHAPPPPPFPMTVGVRAIGWLVQRLERTPPALRPPAGEAGEWRRAGLVAAGGFSLLAIGIAIFAAFSAAMSRGWRSDWWREPLTIAAFAPVGYFVGFFLAGWAFDLTRGIRYRFSGYVARGVLAAVAIYGTMGLVVPADGGIPLRDWPLMVGIFAIVGGLAGAILWVVHRIRGKLPRQAS